MMEGFPSLPPQVEGPNRGELSITFREFLWTNRSKPRPLHTFARISWWGDSPGIHHDIPLHSSGAASSITFSLRSRKRYITSYLSDISPLQIQILEQTEAPKCIGRIVIDTSSITTAASRAPISATVLSTTLGPPLGTLELIFNFDWFTPGDQIETIHVLKIKESEVGDIDLDPHRDNDQHSHGITDNIDTEIDDFDTKETRPSSNEAYEHANANIDRNQRNEKRDGGVLNSPMQTLLTENQEIAASQLKDNALGLIVHIDSATPTNHLPSTWENGELYASAAWQGDTSSSVYTHVTRCYRTCEHTIAVWHSRLLVTTTKIDALIQQCEQLVGREGGRGKMPPSHGGLLLLYLWHYRGGMHCVDDDDDVQSFKNLSLHENNASHSHIRGTNKNPALPSPFDSLIGCAAIDLQGLLPVSTDDGNDNYDNDAITTHIQGTYPLVSADHKIQGHVKLKIELNVPLKQRLLEHASRCKVESSGGQRGISFQTHHHHHQKVTILSEKQKYAWSESDGSGDLDDALAMVGVAFQGAVSCSDEEEEEEDSVIDKKKNMQSVTGSIMHDDDWMFDISKKNVPDHIAQRVQQSMAMPDNAGVVSDLHEEIRPQKYRPIVFKNTLLPGVVIPLGVKNDKESREF